MSTATNQVRYRRVGAGQDGKEIAQRNKITEGAGDIETAYVKLTHGGWQDGSACESNYHQACRHMFDPQSPYGGRGEFYKVVF